jgi:hypothetical protein
LYVGTGFCLLLFAVNLAALVWGWHDAVFPFQVAKCLGMAFGIAVGIHSLDMRAYYRRHGRLARDG